MQKKGLKQSMADTFTKQQRHDCMSHIRSKNTKPEIMLRKSLFAKGFRYRINNKKLPGTPDIVLTKYRTVIFVNGCFWHGHRNCKKYTVPKTNTDFWKRKVKRNKARDEKVMREPEILGWNIIVVWECQLQKSELTKTVSKVNKELIRNRTQYCNDLQQRKIQRKRPWRITDL